MRNKLLLLAVFIPVILVVIIFSNNSLASDWPSKNFDQTLNRHIVDSSVIGSTRTSFEIDVAYNTQDMVVGNGYFYYSDGATQSTIYAVNVSTKVVEWSKKYLSQITKIIYLDNKACFGADKFYCLNYKTGEEVWSNSPGKFGTATLKAKVYQFDSVNLYGVGYYSNIQKIFIIDSSTGVARDMSEMIITDTIIDIGIAENNAYLSLAHGGVSPSSSIKKIDLSSFSSFETSQSCRSTDVRMLLDIENNQVVLTAPNAAICSYKMDDLSAIAVNRMENLQRFVKYNNKYYSVWGKYSKLMPADNTLANVSKSEVLDEDNFQTDPIVVNEVMYAATSGGAIWSKNLETLDSKYSTIRDAGIARNIIYSDGYLITLFGCNEDGAWKAKVVFSDINNISATPARNFTITSPYNTEGMNQYLGQLHCHYIPDIPSWNKVFNGEPNPAFTVEKYNQAGYDFVALTEHNTVVPMPVIEESHILQIRDAEEVTVGAGGSHVLAIGVDTHTDQNLPLQSRIDEIVNQGGLAILAHPNSKEYPVSLNELISLRNHSGIEAINGTFLRYKYLKKRLGEYSAFDKIDQILALKKKTFVYANDDYTPGDGGFNEAAVIAFAPNNTQQEIMGALKSGNFYALQGSSAPKITIDITGSSLVVNSDRQSIIRFIGDGGKILKAEKDVYASGYAFVGNEKYVRAEVESVETGKKSWTQPVFVNQTINYLNLSAGEHTITAKDAFFKIDTSGEFSLNNVEISNLPEAYPPAGHLSGVYSLNTTGEVNSGNSITYSYKNINLPVSEEQLRIYTYKDEQGIWEPVEANIDYSSKTITASLPHYSLYSLSAEIPDDNQSPSIVLTSPTNFENISGEVMLEANASDNHLVTAVRFVLDNNDIGSDIVPEDGWSMPFDFSEVTTGQHELMVEAEDFVGNVGSASYILNINSEFSAPSITVTVPLEGEILKDISVISGSYISDLEVGKINIYLDDVYIEEAEFADNVFIKNVDWNEFMEGEHILKVELVDEAGNIAITEVEINIGEIITATIISPENRDYFRGEQIPINVAVVPQSNIEIYIDGNLVNNNSTIDLLDYSLGEHKLDVYYKGEAISSVTFSVITNYQDTIAVIKRLEKDGAFKNHGIPTAIIAQLRVAELARMFSAYKAENIIIRNLQQYIKQQSGGSKPKINVKAKNLLAEHIDYLSR
jgi:hypothetical protein